MVAINITISESLDQVISGIPRTVSLTSSVISSIFYTLDGSDPTLFSSIYVGPIVMPTDKTSVTLKLFASNGEIESAILTEVYKTNIINNTRFSRSATDATPSAISNDLYPFGTNLFNENVHFLNNSNAGSTVNDSAKNQIPNGFDSDENPSIFSNQELTSENYNLVFSTTDDENQPVNEIGNFSPIVSPNVDNDPPEQTNQFTKLFNPRALVIFQDVTNEDLSEPPVINRSFFSLNANDSFSDGATRTATGLESPPLTGSFVRSEYNPRDNTITYYYRDSQTNRWIISKTPYQSGGFDGNLSTIALGNKEPGSRFVFTWNPFRNRVLF